MVLQVLGLVIAALVLTHVLYLFWSSVRLNRGRQRLLDQAIAAARDEVESKRQEIERKRHERELAWVGYRKFEVERKVVETAKGDVCSIYLVPHDKRPLPPYRPGQFLTFKLDPESAKGRGKSVVRCYSLSDCPRPNHYRVSIKRIPPPRSDPSLPPGVASSHFHDEIQEGDILDVKAPSGVFYLDTTQERPVVLIGGGVGVTPLLSMLNAIVENGSKRETWFFYGVRNGEEQIAAEHLAAIDREHDNIHVQVCHSRPAPGDEKGSDYHHDRRVSVDLLREVLPSNNYEYYICAPPPMMQALFTGLREWGVPEERIKCEAFGPAAVKKKKRAAARAGELAAGASKVTFSRSAKTCEWSDDSMVLLELASQNGVMIDSGCRVGNCNTCLTAIKEGSVSYIRDPDRMPETGSCLTCIAIPEGDLVLDA